MIVCVCANVTERQLRDFFRDGGNPAKAVSELGVCVQCKTCADQIDNLYKQEATKRIIRRIVERRAK